MIAVKEKLKDSSLFRKLYIADLFFCNIAFLQIPAYVLLVFLFVWGVGLAVYNQRVNNTFFKLRFGLWVGAFLVFSLLSIIINFSATILYSLIMLLHVFVCFFVFYGMHTEPNFDFRSELYLMARFIVYVTTVANIWVAVKFKTFFNRIILTKPITVYKVAFFTLLTAAIVT